MIDLYIDTLKRVNVIFEEVFDLPADERERRLIAYEDSEEVKTMVRQLLKHADRTTNPLARTAYELIAQEGQVFAPGEVVGDRYTIGDEIGRGGMGVVYRAERSDGQFNRAVALKSIRPLAMADERMGGFLREIHLLASLEHPNICRLYDAGTTKEGNPYMVMELIEGDSFDDTKSLDMDSWLRMFIALCDGVSYAHSKRVIHGDIKPKNILIDRGNRPIILDFGIATLIGTPRETDMTVAYASPEQIAGDPMDTRSDIYSLGVILSSKVVSSEDRELKSIARKSIAENPDNRYPTVDALSSDIRKYLDGYPVTSYPATPGYVTSKFLKRHKGTVSAIGFGLFTVILLLAFFLVRINNAQKATIEARNQALLEARTANELLQFQQSMLYGSASASSMLRDIGSADQPLRDTLVLRHFVENVAEKAAEDLKGNPEAYGRMLTVVGDVMSKMGLYDKSDSLFNVALTIEDASMASKARLLRLMSNHEIEQSNGIQAEVYADSSLAIFETIDGESQQETLRSRLQVGNVYRVSGRLDEAYVIFEEALPALERLKGGVVDNEIIDYRWSYAEILMDIERFGESDSIFSALYDFVVNADRVNHAIAGGIADNRAYGLLQQRRLDESKAVLDQALYHKTIEYGTDHVEVAVLLNNMAVVNRVTGDLETALRLYNESLQAHRSLAFPDTFEIAMTVNNMGRLYGNLNQYEIANQYVDESLSYKDQIIRRDSFQYGTFLASKLEVLLSLGRYENALSLLPEAHQFMSTRTPSDYVFDNRLILYEVVASLATRQYDRAYTVSNQLGDDFSRLSERDIISHLGVQYLALEATGRQAESDSLRSIYQARYDSTQVSPPMFVEALMK